MLIRFAAHRATYRLACSLVACLAFAATARAEFAYVVSFSTGELIRFAVADPVGTRTTLVSQGQMDSPAALALGPDGNLYVGVGGDGTSLPTIARYNLSTNTLSTVYTFTGNVVPGAMIFRGNDLLVGRNPFFANTGPIVKITNVTGGTIGESDYTTGGALASSPGLALGADGSLYVSDQAYDSGIASGPVKRFDPTGNYVGQVVASGASGLAGPTGLVIQDGTLFTGSVMNGTIVQTDLGTATTLPFANSQEPFGVGALASLAAGGLLAGSPSGSGNIYRFGQDGTLQSTFTTDLGQIGGIVTTAVVPEPGTYAIIAVGAGIGGALLRRRMKSR